MQEVEQRATSDAKACSKKLARSHSPLYLDPDHPEVSPLVPGSGPVAEADHKTCPGEQQTGIVPHYEGRITDQGSTSDSVLYPTDTSKVSPTTTNDDREYHVTDVKDSPRRRKSLNGIVESFRHIRRLFTSSILNTFHRLHSKPVVSTIFPSGGQVRTNTGFTCYDVFPTKLQTRIHQEIRSHHCSGNRSGFLPPTELIKLLSLSAIEKELRKRDDKLKKRKGLGHLRFGFPESTNEETCRQRKARILEEAERIRGDSSQHKLPTTPEQTQNAEELPQRDKSYLKVFAILILIERPARIKLFVEHEVCDSDLPLVRHPLSGSRFELRKKGDCDSSLKCFEGWSYSTIARFEKWQWALLAPIFAPAQRKNIPHYKFAQETILPITEVQIPETLAGGFGDVRKVEIHRDHHNVGIDETENQYYAIKTLKSRRDEEGFKRELAPLRRFQRDEDTQKQLICLLGTYEMRGSYHFIFPWAEMDLHEYWKRHTPTSFVQQDSPDRRSPSTKLLWLAEQCQGIAEGLGNVHRLKTYSGKSLLDPSSLQYRFTIEKCPEQNTAERFILFGRHGDIKPENILWFPNSNETTYPGQGMLKIADFGLAEFSKSEVGKSSRAFHFLSPTYLPPESVLDTKFFSPSYDIWSLGCVYLEFATWWLGGWNLVQDFANKRLEQDVLLPGFQNLSIDSEMRMDVFFRMSKTDTCSQLDADVKGSVVEFIETGLKKHDKANSFIQDFVDLVAKNMLIVERNSVSGIKQSRMSAANIGGSIHNMRSNHLGVVEYGTS